MWLDLGPFRKAFWHPDGKGRGVRAFLVRGQYVEPLGSGVSTAWAGKREGDGWAGAEISVV